MSIQEITPREFLTLCKECGEEYEEYENYEVASVKYLKMCLPCYLKKNFINWNSENEKIDELIQNKQLEIDDYEDIIFEWIPYNQFENIENMNNKNSAVWKDGPLYYDDNKMKLTRESNKQVILKYISQDNVDELLNKVY